MNRNGIAILAALVVVALIAFIGIALPAKAITPYEMTLGSNSGFLTGTKTLSLSSTAAVQCPDLPDGAHEVWVMSVNAINFGDSTVGSTTAELFIASDTVQVFDKIIVTSPEIYFIPRYQSVATLTLQFR